MEKIKKNIFIGTLIIFAILGLSIILYIGGRPKARIAFVIDDWGYNKRNIDLLFQIKRPLTISILPNLRYSGYIAEAVKENDEMYDIILHLPLESRNNEAVEANTIRTNMEKDRILSILEQDIKTIPGLIGVSNHQGSKATGDEKTMGIILGELKKRGLFFLDSVTTPDSVSHDIARGIGLRFLKRDVFLDLTDQTDHKHFSSYIKKQIRELAAIALKRGNAVGVGHNKKTTLEVIKEIIPELERQGIIIVPLEKLVR